MMELRRHYRVLQSQRSRQLKFFRSEVQSRLILHRYIVELYEQTIYEGMRERTE